MQQVQLIQTGNTAYFEQVYYEYHEKIYSYLLKKSGSEDVAEELTQITFIKLWQNRSRLSPDFPLWVQLARIARSLWIDALRKLATERKALETIKTTQKLFVNNDPAISRELRERIENAVNALPPQCQKIYRLNREEGLTYQQISLHLSISPKTVENQIAKALRLVRKSIALSVILM